MLVDHHGVRILVKVACAYECSFFLHKLVSVVLFIKLLGPSEGLHSKIKSIHRSSHSADKLRFAGVYKAIDFVGINLDLFSLLVHTVVRLCSRVNFLFGTLQPRRFAKVYSLGVLELFNCGTFLLALRKVVAVINFYCVLVLG